MEKQPKAIAIPRLLSVPSLGSEFEIITLHNFCRFSPRFGTDAGWRGIDDAYYFSLPLGANKAYSPHHVGQFLFVPVASDPKTIHLGGPMRSLRSPRGFRKLGFAGMRREVWIRLPNDQTVTKQAPSLLGPL